MVLGVGHPGVRCCNVHYHIHTMNRDFSSEARCSPSPALFADFLKTACKRGKRPLSLTESPVGEGAGGFNLDSVPHKGKKEQKILNRE